MLSGKCRLKKNTTTHLLECSKFLTRAIPDEGRDVKEQTLSVMADGNAK